MTPADEFKEWDCLYIARKELKLDVVDQGVGIIHFLNFDLIFVIYEYCRISY